MKKLYVFLFTVTLLYSCSDEQLANNTIINPATNFGLFKQLESISDGTIWQTLKADYTDDEKLLRLTETGYNYVVNTYEVIYQNNIPTSVNRDIDYVDPTDVDQNVDYTVSYDNNVITLTPIPDNVFKKIVIETSNGYVDSYKQFYGENEEYFLEEIYSRSNNGNIESISVYDTNQSGSNIFVWEYSFSGFDQNSNLNANYNPIFDVNNNKVLTILGLKISDQNPTTSSRTTSNQTEDNYRNFYFDVITNGFAQSGTLQYNTDSTLINFSYY